MGRRTGVFVLSADSTALAALVDSTAGMGRRPGRNDCLAPGAKRRAKRLSLRPACAPSRGIGATTRSTRGAIRRTQKRLVNPNRPDDSGLWRPTWLELLRAPSVLSAHQRPRAGMRHRRRPRSPASLAVVARPLPTAKPISRSWVKQAPRVGNRVSCARQASCRRRIFGAVHLFFRKNELTPILRAATMAAPRLRAGGRGVQSGSLNRMSSVRR